MTMHTELYCTALELLDPVAVIFRAVKSGEHRGSVAAFFPTRMGTNDPWTCECYAHVGQHGTASKDYYRDTRPATPQEVEPLKRELESIGYVLEVCNRWTPAFDDTRSRGLNTFKPISVLPPNAVCNT